MVGTNRLILRQPELELSRVYILETDTQPGLENTRPTRVRLGLFAIDCMRYKIVWSSEINILVIIDNN